MNRFERNHTQQNPAQERLIEFEKVLQAAGSFSKADQIDLVEKFAQPLGEMFATPNQRKQKINRSQMRSFYDTVLQIGFQADAEEEKIVLQLLYLRAKTAYKLAQKNVTEEFGQFVKACCKAIRTVQDFDAFVRFFEAVYAYHYARAKS